MTIREVFFGSSRFTPKQERLRQLVMYPFAGIFTAIANFVAFVLMDLLIKNSIDVVLLGNQFNSMIVLKQLVSWIATILTAYTTNRIFVFRSCGKFLVELLGFALARLSTFILIELVLFAGMVMFLEHKLGISQHQILANVGSFKVTYLYLVKIVNSIILVILNFVMSKWLIFRSALPAKISTQRSNSDGLK